MEPNPPPKELPTEFDRTEPMEPTRPPKKNVTEPNLWNLNPLASKGNFNRIYGA